MCVAVPAKVTKIENNTATVEVDGNRVTANIGLVDVKEGDYVLIHAGLVIQKVMRNEAEEMAELFNTLKELGENDG
ncbi:MAG: HypC/HybG/HupF family hydrogenase formation chaperone [Firmicutes bacterium]|nr:HypC/HybG/HupF family hydrogenase formation chaperone [Bacillota bacterium]